MKKNNLRLISLLLTFLTFIIIYFTQPSKNELCKKALENAKQMEYNGIIKQKYIDKSNHAIPTYIVGNMNNYDTKISDFLDMSGLFEYLEIGDSVVKISDSYNVKVIRNDMIKSFTLNYGCH